MRQDHSLSQEQKQRIITKSMFRLRHWVHKEMHRPWPDTNKIWRIKQRCRRYEQQLDSMNQSDSANRTTQH